MKKQKKNQQIQEEGKATGILVYWWERKVETEFLES